MYFWRCNLIYLALDLSFPPTKRTRPLRGKLKRIVASRETAFDVT